MIKLLNSINISQSVNTSTPSNALTSARRLPLNQQASIPLSDWSFSNVSSELIGAF